MERWKREMVLVLEMKTGMNKQRLERTDRMGNLICSLVKGMCIIMEGFQNGRGIPKSQEGRLREEDEQKTDGKRVWEREQKDEKEAVRSAINVDRRFGGMLQEGRLVSVRPSHALVELRPVSVYNSNTISHGAPL